MKRKNVLVLGMTIVLIGAMLSGCGKNSDKKKNVSVTSEQSQQKKSSQNENSSAVAMKRTSNSNLIPLNNAEGIYDEKKGSSWVKIATIWDPELTLYDTESYVKDTKAIAVTFNVTGLDIKDMKCYWNYMIADSQGNEISCWDTNYKTDDVKIEKDGTYQMVFDVSKVDGGDVAELKSLQLVFPDTSTATTMKVKVTDAVCVTDAKEIGTIYKTGFIE